MHQCLRLNRAVRPEGGPLIAELFHRFAALALRAACPSASSDASRVANVRKTQGKSVGSPTLSRYSGTINSSANRKARA
jgi:hypothetical protein